MRTEHYDSIKDAKINIRIDQLSLDLIDAAARIQGKNRSSFMLESSRKKAQKVLLDQTHFYLDDDDWEKFNKALEYDPVASAKIKKLLNTKSPWE